LVLYRKFVKLTLSFNSDPFFAKRTQAKIKENSWGEPSYLEPLFKTFDMENMTAAAFNTGRSRQSFNVTDCTILVTINSVELRNLFCTFFIQAR